MTNFCLAQLLILLLQFQTNSFSMHPENIRKYLIYENFRGHEKGTSAGDWLNNC